MSPVFRSGGSRSSDEVGAASRAEGRSDADRGGALGHLAVPGRRERHVHAVREQFVDPVVVGLVVGVVHHAVYDQAPRRVEKMAPGDGRRHDAARRRDERDVEEAMASPSAEERVGGEEVDGVDLADHQHRGLADAVRVVQRGQDEAVRLAERQHRAGVHRPQRAAAKHGDVAEARLQVRAEAAALPQAQLLRVEVDERVEPRAALGLIRGRRQPSGSCANPVSSIWKVTPRAAAVAAAAPVAGDVVAHAGCRALRCRRVGGGGWGGGRRRAGRGEARPAPSHATRAIGQSWLRLATTGIHVVDGRRSTRPGATCNASLTTSSAPFMGPGGEPCAYPRHVEASCQN